MSFVQEDEYITHDPMCELFPTEVYARWLLIIAHCSLIRSLQRKLLNILIFLCFYINLNILTFWVMIMMMMTTMMMVMMTMIIMMVRWGAACATEQLLEPLTGATSFLKILIYMIIFNLYFMIYSLQNSYQSKLLHHQM